MTSLIRAAVFASGTGSNYEAIMETKNLPCDIVLLVCDQPEARVIEKAKRYDTPIFVFDPKTYKNKEAYEQDIAKQLKNARIDWIFLAGYMRIIGPILLKQYEGKIINIHPSLLPKFPGKDAIGQAMEADVDVTGVTVHYVDEGIDTGPIIAQERVNVLQDDTKETLQQKIQAVEHDLYPRVIKKLLGQ